MTIKIDLHAHSRHGSFDGRCSYEEIAAESISKGLDLVVITEHDTPTDPAVLEEVSKRCGFLLLPGLEYSIGQWGHFLVFGGEEFLRKQKLRRYHKQTVLEALGSVQCKIAATEGIHLSFDDFMEMISGLRLLFKEDLLTPLEFCRAARVHGAYIVWAHPFVDTPLSAALDLFLSNGGRLDLQEFAAYLEEHEPQVFEVLSEVNAFEGLNGRTQGLVNHLASGLAAIVGKPVTAGSDGHREGEYGRVFMVVDCQPDDVSDIPSLIRALSSCEWKLQYG